MTGHDQSLVCCGSGHVLFGSYPGDTCIQDLYLSSSPVYLQLKCLLSPSAGLTEVGVSQKETPTSGPHGGKGWLPQLETPRQ